MGAGIQQAKLAHINGLGENAGGNIRHQGHAAGVRQLVPHRAVDGVVHADVEVIRVRPELVFVERRMWEKLSSLEEATAFTSP